MLTDFAIKNISASADFDDLYAFCRAYKAHIADRDVVNTDQAVVRFDLHSIEQRPVIEGGNAYFEGPLLVVTEWREGTRGQAMEGVHVEIAYADFEKTFAEATHCTGALSESG